MNNTRVLAVVACLLLVASPETLAKKMKGKVRDGVFTSPLGDYTVTVPKFAFGTRMNQTFHDHGGSVSFHSDFSDVAMILCQEMAPPVADKLDDPDLATETLRGYLENYILPEVLRKAAPRTELVHSESVVVGNTPAYFGIAMMPEGSVLEDLRTHKRMDDTRGLLILARGKHIYMLAVGSVPNLLDAGKAPPPIEEQLPKLRKRVEDFYGTVTFTGP